MAEVRKKKIEDKYDTESVKKKVKENKKNSTKEKVKTSDIKKKEEKVNEKKGLIAKIRIFCHGVKSEFDRVHWPSKNDMIKYSIATILFIVFFAGFFYLIDIVFAFVRSLFA